MGTVSDDSTISTAPATAGPANGKPDQGIKQPLLAKVPSSNATMVPAGPAKTELPAFRLAAEGLGGVRLAVVWVM